MRALLPTDTYDLVFAIGLLMNGHAPVSALDDMVHAAKPGIIIATLNQNLMFTSLMSNRDFKFSF